MFCVTPCKSIRRLWAYIEWLHLISDGVHVKNNIQFLPDMTGKGKKKGKEEVVVVVVVSVFLIKT